MKQCFNDNIITITELTNDNTKIYQLTDQIKKELTLDAFIIKNM